MPLLSLESPWEVLGETINKIVRGEGRNMKYKDYRFTLQSSIRPTPILKGVMGRESRKDSLWRTEIHRNGFVQAIYMDIDTSPDDAEFYVLHDGYAELFKAFCDLVESLWRKTQTDIPYIFRLKYFNADKTIFLSNPLPEHYTPPFDRRVIAWPEQFRQVGDPVEMIHRIWIETLFHAFGLNWEAPKQR